MHDQQDNRPKLRISVDAWSQRRLDEIFAYIHSKTGLRPNVDFQTRLDDGTTIDMDDPLDVKRKMPLHRNHVGLTMLFRTHEQANAVSRCCSGPAAEL
jgi:hypothetical protein